MGRFFYTCCYIECPRTRIDASKIFNYLEGNGWKPVKRVSKADLVVIFGCGGFDSTELRSVKTIKRVLSHKKKSAKLIVTGCLPKINPNPIKDLGEMEIISDNDLRKVDAIISATRPYDDFPDANIVSGVENLDDISKFQKFISRFSFDINFFKYLTRALRKRANRMTLRMPYALPEDIFNVRISNGCLGECTYCAIKLARGRLRSKPIKRIIEEFKEGMELGYRRFMFVAQDMGCYGLDIGTNIGNLLEEVFEEERAFKLIITDLNIQWLIKENNLLGILIKNQDKIEEIRIPIQSGSDKILKAMKRRYNKEEIHGLLSKIREKMPDLKINTHFLVGFPGETHNDFMDTMHLTDYFDFHKIDVFCYQDRPGVRSVTLPNKINKKLRFKRAHELASKGRNIDIVY